MRAFVFTDPALESRAGRFVWLEIDTEKAENSAFLEKFPVDSLPTFFVLDPRDERVARRWVGSLTVAHTDRKEWDEALAASDRAQARVYGPRKLRVLLVRAEIHAGRGDKVSARRTLAEAVAFAEALPAGQRSERTLESLRRRLRSLE